MRIIIQLNQSSRVFESYCLVWKAVGNKSRYAFDAVDNQPHKTIYCPDINPNDRIGLKRQGLPTLYEAESLFGEGAKLHDGGGA